MPKDLEGNSGPISGLVQEPDRAAIERRNLPVDGPINHREPSMSRRSISLTQAYFGITPHTNYCSPYVDKSSLLPRTMGLLLPCLARTGQCNWSPPP